MSNIAKIGRFSDGQERIRIVKNGFNADPAPSDDRNIIFDSDWPDVVKTRSGYYGSQSVSYTFDSSNNLSSSPLSITWSPLSYYPLYTVLYPFRISSHPYASPLYSSAFISATSSAYYVTPLNRSSSNGFTYYPVGINYQNYPYSGNETMGWWALLLDTNALGNTIAPSRNGTNFIKLTKDGPVVTKPGASVSSTSPDDYLIAPSSMGEVLGQPYMSATLSSLPYYSSYSVTPPGSGTTTYYEYVAIINHGLGYIPIFLVTRNEDFQFAPLISNVYIDTSNIYIRFVGSSHTSSASITPVSYFVYRAKLI